MLSNYLTLLKEASDELIIKKSRFIVYARPLDSESQFIDWYESLRKSHPFAHHYCYAYLIGDRNECQKQSDDGEPSGTAGKPMLEVLKQQGMMYSAVLVVRYFGGIPLGAGGLVRAYTEACVRGIQVAEKVYRIAHQQVDITTTYHWLGKIQHMCAQQNIKIGQISYSDCVNISTFPFAHRVLEWQEKVQELTQGESQFFTQSIIYLSHLENPFLG